MDDSASIRASGSNQSRRIGIDCKSHFRVLFSGINLSVSSCIDNTAWLQLFKKVLQLLLVTDIRFSMAIGMQFNIFRTTGTDLLPQLSASPKQDYPLRLFCQFVKLFQEKSRLNALYKKTPMMFPAWAFIKSISVS